MLDFARLPHFSWLFIACGLSYHEWLRAGVLCGNLTHDVVLCCSFLPQPNSYMCITGIVQ